MPRLFVIIGILAIVGLSIFVGVFLSTRQLQLPEALTQPTWQLQSLTGGGQVMIMDPQPPITLRFTPTTHSLNGSSGCNAYGISYQVQGTRLKLSRFYTTLVGCLDGDVKLHENQYDAALNQGQEVTFTLEGATLTLTSSDGNEILRYTHAAPQGVDVGQ